MRTVNLRHEIKRCAECGQRYSPDAMFCPFDGGGLVLDRWDPSGDTLLGKIVGGRYEVIAVLGEGGMGTVYKVRHSTLGRHFAMKVMRLDLARDEKLAARFIQEARATAAVKHPNIVSITDFGHLETDNRPYFVMELLHGQTLSEVLKDGPLTPTRGVAILIRIAHALGAAHEAGIIHRDLKPENIFVADGDDELGVRVVDFGAAMIVGASRITKTGVVFGTPHYMSPEQAGGQTVDHRADIYSLGVIMYEMFTGRVPFEADTFMGVISQHMFVKPVAPTKAVPGIRGLGALEPLILKALEKTPANRYATMDALARDLERVGKAKRDGDVSLSPAQAGRDEDVAPFTVKDPAGLTRSPLAIWGLRAAGIASVAVVVFLVTRLLYEPSARVEVRASSPPVLGVPAVAPAIPSTPAEVILPPPAPEPVASVQTAVKIRPSPPAPKPVPSPPRAPPAPPSEFRDPWAGK